MLLLSYVVLNYNNSVGVVGNSVEWYFICASIEVGHPKIEAKVNNCNNRMDPRMFTLKLFKNRVLSSFVS